MKRHPIHLSHVVVRFLTLAITVVVGFQLGPRLAARSASTPVVGCADQKVSEDTFKVGERSEQRVFRAAYLDRLPPASPSHGSGAVSRAAEALALDSSLSDRRSVVERLPIVKHVPRMERGDPPRT
jgi:hypothetical protein